MELLNRITESMEVKEDIANYDKGAAEIAIPVFTPPYPVRVHPMGAETSKAIREWLAYHSVDKVFHPERFTKLQLCVEFAALMFPDASANDLDLFSKFLIGIYLVDDIMDDTELERSWETSVSLALCIDRVITSTIPGVQSLTDQIVQIFAPDRCETIQNLFRDVELYNVKDSHINPCEVYGGKASAIGSCFRDNWDEVVKLMQPNSCLRLARYYQKFLIFSLLQIQNRENGIIPFLDEYIPMRREAGATACCLNFVDLTDGVFLSEEIFSSPEFQGFVDIYRDIMSWCNDLWSFKREYLVNGDIHNLVFLISHHCRCSCQRAAWLINEMLCAQWNEFEARAEELLKATNDTKEDQRAVCKYIEGCRRFISATHEWHKGSLLYK